MFYLEFCVTPAVTPATSSFSTVMDGRSLRTEYADTDEGILHDQLSIFVMPLAMVSSSASQVLGIAIVHGEDTQARAGTHLPKLRPMDPYGS
jgi:hypothetical protein